MVGIGMSASRINSLLARGLRRAAAKVDFFHAGVPDLRNGLKLLARHGLAPDTIVDVGAFEGQWSRSVSSIFPQAELFLFEPQADKHGLIRENLRGKRFTLRSDLLADTEGREVTFYKMASGSSYKEELTSFSRRCQLMTTSTLDKELGSVALGKCLLKLDTQGSELEILTGAEHVLSHAECIVMEVGLLPYNNAAPLVHQAMDFMAAKGFRLVDIVSLHRRRSDGATLQFDGVFLPEHGRLWRQLSSHHLVSRG